MSKIKEKYKGQLKHPKWRQLTEKLKARTGYRCEICGMASERTEDKKANEYVRELDTHHVFYIYGRDLWDYPENMLKVLCDDCHGFVHEISYEHGISKNSLLIGYYELLKSRLGHFTESEITPIKHPLNISGDKLTVQQLKYYDEFVREGWAQEIYDYILYSQYYALNKKKNERFEVIIPTWISPYRNWM